MIRYSKYRGISEKCLPFREQVSLLYDLFICLCAKEKMTHNPKCLPAFVKNTSAMSAHSGGNFSQCFSFGGSRTPA